MIPSNRQTTIEWPEDLLGCPLASGYGSVANPQFDRTGIEEAPPGFFRMRVHDNRRFTLNFLWTPAQLVAFETFLGTTLNKGMRWFMMKQMADVRQNPLFCHVVGGYTLGPQDGSLTHNRVAFDVVGFWRSA